CGSMFGHRRSCRRNVQRSRDRYRPGGVGCVAARDCRLLWTIALSKDAWRIWRTDAACESIARPMHLTRRPLAPNELDHELVWLTVSLGSLGFAIVWLWLRLPWPHCIFLSITGHPCLTCGATRCAIVFFHFDFWSAWKWNP